MGMGRSLIRNCSVLESKMGFNIYETRRQDMRPHCREDFQVVCVTTASVDDFRATKNEVALSSRFR
jgi:hypothetical protein